MPALYLTEDDVRDVIDMEVAIDAVEDAFRQLADGTANNVARRRAFAPGIVLHSMSAAAESLGLLGWKNYTTCKSGARFHVAIYSAETGEMTALIEADYLGQMRTGAASGVATSYMARPDAKTVGLFGTGKQARTQLKAVCSVRRIEHVEVYGRDDERRRAFAEEMTEFCATEVVPVHSPNEAAAEKDIIITATTSKGPVFDGKVFDEGTHLNVVGSNFLGKAEIDSTTVQRADRIVCDSIEACQLEAGDFVESLEDGLTDWQLMHELCDVVAGKKTGRAVPEDVTLFKSVGLAIEDVALAAVIVERAAEAGLGSELPF
jgi:ornithine cyclodeaminase/alanine dehydrogenase-like protein (mu-crystallin family)